MMAEHAQALLDADRVHIVPTRGDRCAFRLASTWPTHRRPTAEYRCICGARYFPELCAHLPRRQIRVTVA